MKYPYTYFVSYSHAESGSFGFGYLTLTLTKKINIELIEEIKKKIEDVNPHLENIVIINFQLINEE